MYLKIVGWLCNATILERKSCIKPNPEFLGSDVAFLGMN